MIDDLKDRLAQYGQPHLLNQASGLKAADIDNLVQQIQGIDFDLLKRLHAQSREQSVEMDSSSITPVDAIGLPRTDLDRQRRARAAAMGLEVLLRGRAAAVLVAGGQGSRLGFEAPKGMFSIGPVTGASLFQIHAEKILARSRQSGRTIPWYIMTSPTNDAQTREFFQSRQFFGLPTDAVQFFVQGTMPAIDQATGRVLLDANGQVFLSPDGHGGTLTAMQKEGVLDDMARRGCDVVFYFQVDNPFIDVLEPSFVGHHVAELADVSLKVIRKEHPKEKLGLVVRHNDRPAIIEYSDLPDDLAHRRNSDGDLEFWTGSIAIHLFRREFLERITRSQTGLPFHFAKKKVPYLNESGQWVEPAAPNAVKFERFIFDCLPLAERVTVVETSRVEEYEPVKNAEGEHSPDVVRRAISRKAASWLAQCGVEFPRDADGHPTIDLEISPLAGLSPDDFLRQLKDVGPLTSSTAWTEQGQVSR